MSALLALADSARMLQLTASELMARGVAALAEDPTPSPTPAFNEDDVTPGVVGFVVTALFFVACALLVWSLIRRVSRLQHRERVRAELEAERRQMILDGLDPDSQGAGSDAAAPDGVDPGAPQAPGR